MRPIDYIVIHTNGSPGRTVKQIRAYHLLKGWLDIGYHWVIYEDGTIHPGRPEKKPGAGVKGLNAHTLHVCFVGNGDKAKLTQAQLASGVPFLDDKCRQYGVSIRSVIGHRETRHMVPAKLATTKTCPGTKVSMSDLRSCLSARRLNQAGLTQARPHLKVVK